MFTQVAIIGRRDGIDLQTVLEGHVDHLGTAHYPDTTSAHRNMHFNPDLILLHNATDVDVQQALGVTAWQGKVVCVTERMPDQHHTHKDGVHYCDPDNLQDVVLEILRGKPKVASSH